MPATVKQLVGELVARIKTAPVVGERGYSVFNADDLEEFAGQAGFPLAGVTYEGATPFSNVADSAGVAHKSAAILHHRFLVIIAVTYRYGTDEDSKTVATDLLDQIRALVLGYRGVNTRPWAFLGETPLETKLEGVVMYGQMWETGVPTIGSTPA